MEIDDEDVVVHGTDLQKYLNAVGYSKFEVSNRKNVETDCLNKSLAKEPKYSRKMNRPTQNSMKDFELFQTLIKIITESQLMFKEDTLFIKDFIPSDHVERPSFFTKQNSLTLLILCLFCGILNMFFSEYIDEWTAVCILILWFGFVFIEILYKWNQKIKIKNTVLKTIKSMEKSSLLIQKSINFLHECNNLHSLYNSCTDTYARKNSNAFIYLLMPELKILLLTVLQDLINTLVNNISEIHTFFPLKDSVSNVVYLYLTDCKIDLKDTSLENINKAKYTYFLLQSEFLKQSALCLCPVLWTPNSSSKMNRLIKTIGEIKTVYINSYDDLSEEFNVYSLFKNNIDNYKQPDKDTHYNSDLKLKVYSIRQFLQNMMVHARYMEDSIENSIGYCVDDINSTLNILVKEVNIFNELISTLQIYILKTNNFDKKDKSLLTNDSLEETNHIETETAEPIEKVCEDELFFGISEEIPTEPDIKCYDEEIFDKSNNHNLMLELKVALKEKQAEWKQRECKLLEKNPQLNDLSDEEESTEKQNQYINKVRKVAFDLPPNENFSMQLPDKSFANEIARVACNWNTAIDSFGDNSDSDISMNSTD